MHGDFSRGHEPDRKRGRDYRRVLLQMGRPVLDSDVAASVDAVLGQTRALARGVGCDAGSPDLGFLVTPGRLLTVFGESAERVRATSGAPNVWLDYRWRLAHRYPALYVEAPGAPASVSLPLRAAADPAVSMRAALWAHVEESATISVNGISVPLAPASPEGPGRFELVTGSAPLDPLQITVPADRAVWLYLLEQDEAAGDDPRFWIAPGSYHLDGLVVDARGGGSFPAATFPDAAGFPWQASPDAGPPQAGLLPTGLAVGARFLAYLEAWERHVTDVEDPGIREEALGAGDTCTRAELLGQVKLAAITGAPPSSPYALRGAFERVEVSGGRLTIDVPAATPAEDPCALPDPAGYRGSDNRLYRVEVHDGGGIGQVRFKWSRDNGSELFAARAEGAAQLVFDAGTPLAGGDIVEILSNVTDLGDDVRATVSTGGFVPAWRAVGQLVQLQATGTSGLTDDVSFTLLDAADGVTPVILDERYGVDPGRVLKLRRWHGILEPDGLPGPHALEEGLTVTVSETGSFRPGQYWQYEARVSAPNANGPWRETPHGPERRFAPLAVLEYQGAAEPMALVAWLDDRFSPLCDLNADDIDYAGERAGTASDTVQEALDEIYERLGPQITWPVVVEGGMSWQNDRILPLEDFHAGLRVTFSEDMHPASATPSAFVVTVEVPSDDESVTGVRSPLIVDGVVHVAGPEWTFVPTNVDADSVGRWATALGGPVRCRVRLLSHVILDITGERPLDGDTVGAVSEDGYNARIDLRLPSGDGLRGGDFESWFFLTAPPSRVAVDHVNPPDGGRFAAGDGPRTILLSFSDGVQFSSLGKDTLIVTRRRGDGQEDVVPGTIQPYPFEVEPGVVNRVTFAPDDPEALRPWGEGETWTYTVRLRGSGDQPVVGVDERALDGERIDEGSDFVSSFVVETWKPEEAPKQPPKKAQKAEPKKPAPKRRAPKRTPKKPDEEPEA